MSIELNNQRNVGILVALIVGTIAAIAIGINVLQGFGTNLLEEVGYAIVVLVIALVLYDKLLVM
ncbi:hypothetical protein [Haloferax sp. DFSO52]|uniref:hypothetical protein n=1 Tax=Haloferax sp. DFSO52 TaxID=3388505 RepID=UPI003A838756